MKKFLYILFVFTLVFYSSDTNAQIKKMLSYNPDQHIVRATGFLDYPPIGSIKTEGRDRYFISVFEEVMKDFSQNTGLRIRYVYDGTYPELVRKAQGGEIDLILGVYHDTKMYEEFDIVFPSMINNPISIITLPENSGKIRTLTQLKKLKGGVSNKEHLTDYVTDQLKNFNLEYFDSSNAMFEKLFTGQIDYIFASHFFGIVESSKLGLRDRLSFSKQVIWNMPLFFGVSKMSELRTLLGGKLASYSEKPENKEKLEKYLKKMIYEIEESNRGVVPPAYSLPQQGNN